MRVDLQEVHGIVAHLQQLYWPCIGFWGRETRRSGRGQKGEKIEEEGRGGGGEGEKERKAHIP